MSVCERIIPLPEPGGLALPGQKFRTLLADPPWRFKNWSMAERAERGEQWARRNGPSPYDSMDTEAICALPVADVCQKDAILLLWATNPKLPDAFAVLAAWGFEYKSMLTWVKMQRAAAPRIGLGYHARSCTEHLLIGGRGANGCPDAADRPAGVVFCPIGEHSRKPDFQYDLAENYPGPYLELFSRPRPVGLFPPREGWVHLGNEVTGNDITDDLRALLSPEPLRPTPPSPWLTPHHAHAADPQPGARITFLGQDGARLEATVTARRGDRFSCEVRLGQLAVPYEFNGDWPAGLAVVGAAVAGGVA